MKTKDTGLEVRELNQARSKLSLIDRSVRTAHTIAHHYNGTQHCNNNNNNNKHDNVYGAVIMAEPLREFTRFIR